MNGCWLNCVPPACWTCPAPWLTRLTCGRSKGEHTGPSPVDRRKPGSKHHLITDGTGIPLAATLTGGHRNDVTQLLPLLDTIPPIRGVVGKPWRRPRYLYADRGYDHDKYRRLVRARGITPMIARRSVDHGAGLGTIRWPVERTFAWLRGFDDYASASNDAPASTKPSSAWPAQIICLRKLILN